MKKLKIFLSLAIVSAIMATGLISAFALPEYAKDIKGSGVLGGSTSKLNQDTVQGVSVLSCNSDDFIEVKLWIEQGFKKSNGSNGWTQSPNYYSSSYKTISKTLGAGWGCTVSWGRSTHSGATWKDGFSTQSGYNY